MPRRRSINNIDTNGLWWFGINIACGAGNWANWGWGWWTWNAFAWCLFEFSPGGVAVAGGLAGLLLGIAAGILGLFLDPIVGLIIGIVVGLIGFILGVYLAYLSFYYAPNGLAVVVWAFLHLQWNWPWSWHNWASAGWYWWPFSSCPGGFWGWCA